MNYERRKNIDTKQDFTHLKHIETLLSNKPMIWNFYTSFRMTNENCVTI